MSKVVSKNCVATETSSASGACSFSPCHIFCTLLKWNSCSPVQQLLDECKWILVAITRLGEASFLLSGFKMENDVEGNVKDDWLLLRVTLAHLHTEECC